MSSTRCWPAPTTTTPPRSALAGSWNSTGRPGLLHRPLPRLLGSDIPHRPARHRPHRRPPRPARVRPRRMDQPRDPPTPTRCHRPRAHRVRAGHPHPQRAPHRPLPRPARPAHHRHRPRRHRAHPRVRRPPNATATRDGPKYLNTPDTPCLPQGRPALHRPRPTCSTPAPPPSWSKDPWTPSPSASQATAATSASHRSAPPSPRNKPASSRSTPTTSRQPIVATDPTSPARSPPTATTGSSPNTASTPPPSRCAPAATPPTCCTCTAPTNSATTLTGTTPLADTLLAERLTNLAGIAAARQAVAVLAAGDPARWETGIERIAEASGTPAAVVRRDLNAAVSHWDRDPHAAATSHAHDLRAARARLPHPTAMAAPGQSDGRHPSPVAPQPTVGPGLSI